MKNLTNSNTLKTIASIVLFAISILIFFITYQQRQTALVPHAWQTNQNASARCTDEGIARIQVSFTNTEPPGAQWAMKVVATDIKTGKKVDLGVIQSGETKTGIIDMGQASVEAGTVQFLLTWADGRSGTDKRTAGYQAVNCVPKETPTPTPSPSPTGAPSPTPTPSPSPSPTTAASPTPTRTPTPSPSPTRTPTPSVTPTGTITPGPSATVTPTPTRTPTPSLTPTGTPPPSNTPTPTLTYTPTPTITPTGTPPPTYTPQPTYTPVPTYTGQPTPTPTEIIIVVNNTSTPTPQTTNEPTVPAAGVPVAWFIVLVPVLLIAVGLIF